MKVDMSAKAVTTRLKRVSQLRQLCLSLGKARIVTDSIQKPQKKKIEKQTDSASLQDNTTNS